MFESRRLNSFHMTFENGLTISVTWNIGTYSDNHFPDDPSKADWSGMTPLESRTAEAAVLTPDGEFVDPDEVLPGIGGDGMVAGYLSPEQVLQLMIATANKEV